MRCENVRPALAGVVDGSVRLGDGDRRHVEQCLRCQAEVVQYHKLLRAMHNLRFELLEPVPSLLAEILASVEEAGERQAVRSLLGGRRVAYLGGIAAATAAGAAGALVFASRSRRSAFPWPASSRPVSQRPGRSPNERWTSRLPKPLVGTAGR